jgi:hypothetical protein
MNPPIKTLENAWAEYQTAERAFNLFPSKKPVFPPLAEANPRASPQILFYEEFRASSGGSPEEACMPRRGWRAICSRSAQAAAALGREEERCNAGKSSMN